ncbi:hypothetical protein FB45DRAFT_890455 [Roridomyces roridus]|uniref:Uncharacterized protein n=1 Tax=Roridomyces roridus TaxID=1738132 RepID=A0AAD7CKZ3_9AGAR|nr:hypothetical protein FB45DRAFT_890455 [Roridomyces roridus]
MSSSRVSRPVERVHCCRHYNAPHTWSNSFTSWEYLTSRRNIWKPWQTLNLNSLTAWDTGSFCDEPVLRAIQRLLANPALRAVRMLCTFRNEADIARIWDGCSESIKHLEYSFNLLDQAGDAVFHEAGARRRIKLDSFESNNVAEILLWLQDPSCPLDLSDLKALQFTKPVEALFNSVFGPVYDNVQILSTDPDILDLSRFRLSQLEISTTFPPTQHFHVLRTIRPENRHPLRSLIIRPSRLTTDVVEETIRHLPKLGAEFPNLKLVVIAASLAFDKVKMTQVKYFRSPDSSITLRCYSKSVDLLRPWYNKIV